MALAPVHRQVRIVFASNADAGQFNVHLAVIHSLLEYHKEDVELHIYTHAKGRGRIPSGVKYHEVPGISMVDVLKSDKEISPILLHRPSFLGVFSLITKFPYVLNPYSAAEYINLARDAEDVLERVQPDLVVIDPVLFQMSDAAKKLGVEHIILSPGAWTDDVNTMQGFGVFRWPAMGTGWPKPVPLYLLPLNIVLLLSMALAFVVHPFHRVKMAARRQAGYTWDFMGNAGDVKLCMGLPQLELDGIRPPNVFPIGPILLPTPPLADIDEDLWTWLNKDGYPTITFALGSHYMFDKEQAESLLRTFDTLLEQRPDVRICAKMMRMGEYDLPLLEVMQTKWKGRLMVVEWLKADPIAILKTGKIGLAIHHGGSNSFHEALSLGIPQIALSAWLDCHDFGVRIERLGIGRWGNRKAGPGFTSSELLSAIFSIIGKAPSDEVYDQYLSRAQQYARVAVEAGLEVKGHDGASLTLLSGGERAAESQGRDLAGEWIYRKARSVMA